MLRLVTSTLLLLCLIAAASAEPPKPADQKTESTSWGEGNAVQRNCAFIAREFIDLADAMPDDKYSFAPSSSMGEFKDARTFGKQVLHVANANMEISYAVMGKKFTPDPNKPATKAEALPFLKQSFDVLQQAAASLTQQNAMEKVENPFGGPAPYGGTPDRLGMLIMAASHDRDHYGQLALYLRMNGIIPPASRK